MAGLARTILGVIWELPQTLLGAGLLAAEKVLGTVEGVQLERGRVIVRSKRTAVSLGYVVFWAEGESRWFVLDGRTRAHEIGHTYQSRMLGPLYLPFVGVPSTMRVLYAIAFREVTGRRWQGYFDGYPEDWADRLGGVARPPP